MRYFKEKNEDGGRWDDWDLYNYFEVPEDEIYEGLFECELEDISYIHANENDIISFRENLQMFLVAGDIIILWEDRKSKLPEKYKHIEDEYDFDEARGDMSRIDFAEKIGLPVEGPDDWECHEVWVYWDGSNFCGKTLSSPTDPDAEKIEEITKEEYEKATGGEI